MAEKFSYEIVENVAVLSDNGIWAMELNKVSWNKRKPSFDLRKWSEGHEKMSKGISFNEEEAEALYHALKEIFEEEAE